MTTNLKLIEIVKKVNNPNQTEKQPKKSRNDNLTKKELELKELKKKLAEERKALNEEKRNLGID
ncbi:MAG TPA: hypothetical protein PKY82_15210 [Pyrinomonadaceae bacterium]|nr:hypothetical protein [Pyrinomonadaceae bacterium]